jgi:hypothetical protein
VDSTWPAYRGGVGDREAINGQSSAAASSWLDRRSRRSGAYQRSSLLLDYEGVGLRSHSQMRKARRNCIHKRLPLRNSQDRYGRSSESVLLA